MEIAVNYYLCVLDRIWHIEEIFFTNKVGSQELLGCNLFFNLEINNCIKHSAFSYVLVQKKKKKEQIYWTWAILLSPVSPGVKKFR